MIAMLQEQWLAIDEQVENLEAELRAVAEQDDACARLASIPEIGAVTATAIVAAIGDGQMFRSGRDFAAWLGLGAVVLSETLHPEAQAGSLAARRRPFLTDETRNCRGEPLPGAAHRLYRQAKPRTGSIQPSTMASPLPATRMRFEDCASRAGTASRELSRPMSDSRIAAPANRSASSSCSGVGGFRRCRQ